MFSSRSDKRDYQAMYEIMFLDLDCDLTCAKILFDDRVKGTLTALDECTYREEFRKQILAEIRG